MTVDFSADILLYAFRYALGRRSYAVGIVQNQIRDAMDELPDNIIKAMIADIKDPMYNYTEFKEEWDILGKELEAILKERRELVQETEPWDIRIICDRCGALLDSKDCTYHKPTVCPCGNAGIDWITGTKRFRVWGGQPWLRTEPTNRA